MKLKTNLIILVLLSTLHCLLSAGTCAQPPKFIRVSIFADTASLNIKASGFYEIKDKRDGKVLAQGRNLKATAVAYQDGILFAKKIFNYQRIFIKTASPDLITINNKVFRADVELIKNAKGKLSAINFIELEDYVRGISIREISHYWPPEAIKACVVAFRTFALYKMEENVRRDYDLTSDIYSQVYSGKAAERERINKIVDQTLGVVLTYRGKILPSFYHAACGGHTEDALRLWKVNLACLKGVVCNFCKDSPHYRWHAVLSLNEIRQHLSGSGYNIGKIKDIAILGRDDSGRITALKISDSKKEIEVPAKGFRDILGPNIIRSTNFKLDIIDDDAVLEGMGWGHGVGLCQWGAYFMAKEGYTAEEILRYYYPGSEIAIGR
jgi:stage II sporulation protein D